MEDQAMSEPLLARFAGTFGEAAAALLVSRQWVTYVVGPELKIKHFLAGNTDPREQEDYERIFGALDPLAPEACLGRHCHVARLGDMLQANLFAHQQYQRGFLQPHGIVDALEIFIQSDAGLTVGCSVLRHQGEKEFGAEECQRAQALKPLGDFALSRTFPQRRASLQVLAERFPQLTTRETMLMQLVAAGLNNKQLCKELDISLPTVKTHLNSIFRKMNVNNRTELAARILS